jgi:hypothetical protein
MNLTPEKLTAFLSVLAGTANVTAAADTIGMSRQALYNRREVDSDFAAAWTAAEKIGVEGMKDEVNRRAFSGVEEPVFYQGSMCGSVRKYSDTLAMFLIKARDPSYRDSSKLELSGQLAVSNMTDDEINAELAALAAFESTTTPPDDGSDLI